MRRHLISPTSAEIEALSGSRLPTILMRAQLVPSQLRKLDRPASDNRLIILTFFEFHSLRNLLRDSLLTKVHKTSLKALKPHKAGRISARAGLES